LIIYIFDQRHIIYTGVGGNFNLTMKKLILSILFLASWTLTVGQELMTIRDTVNHFAIGVPFGWRYGVPADNSVTFIALRQKLDDQDFPRENFNVNILQMEETDLEKSFSDFLESVGQAEGFKVIEKGEKIIQDRKYKYLIEIHKNKISKEDMNNYVLFTNNNGEILILTMVTTSTNFEKYKTLFDSVGLSLSY
jgi:hypothetical protein